MTGPLLSTGIACAVVLAAVFAWSRWRGPRVRRASIDERIRAAAEGEWQDQALENVAEDGER